MAGTDAQIRGSGLQALGRLADLGQRVQGAAGEWINRTPELGRPYAEPSALEHFSTEPAFEVGDPLGRPRLGQREGVGGPLHRTCLYAGREGGELAPREWISSREGPVHYGPSVHSREE